MPKPLHYCGDYHVRSRQVRNAAYADPTTRCWRCGHTLPNCKPHRNGTPARWTAGHVIDGDPTSPLLAECSPCNKSEGARYGNARRRRTGGVRNPQRAGRSDESALFEPLPGGPMSHVDPPPPPGW